MKIFRTLVFFCFLLLCSLKAYPQGCSDAGVCSAGSLGLVAQFSFELLPLDETKLLPLPEVDPGIDISKKGRNSADSSISIQSTTRTQTHSSDSVHKSGSELKYSYRFPRYYFQFSTSYAVGDQRTTIITTQLEANVRLIDKKIYGQVKVPYTFISGKLADVNGLSDVTLSLNYMAFIKKKSMLSFTVGVKLPTDNSNRSVNNMPLPMVYQTSLGTTDLLVGLKYTFRKWDLTAGYQHAFNKNQNNYLQDPSVGEDYNKYLESRLFKRSDDVILRVSRNLYYKKLNVNAGLLGIYHLSDDSYSNALGERVQVKNSQGLTLNINLASVVKLSEKFDLLAVFASPVITRQARP
ncbi:MAG: hypothetical protein M3R27_11750, partial [Bacteroidota bacterium]|nr:hypothetical protein [Bacteroidota bacterium]